MLINNIYKYVANIINGHSYLLLAYSGGIDSTVLLDILTKLKNEYSNLLLTPIFSLRTIHINHNLYKNSLKWITHCEEESKKRNISCKIFSINITDTSEGIESAARKIRYNILIKNLLPNETLLLAHHENDQTETFLLALKRGSGPSGLASMAEQKIINNNYILRPLLYCNKNFIEEYAKKNNLYWIDDPTNFNTKFDRNYLRSEIIPLIQQRWPYFSKCVARSAKLCAEQECLLDELLFPFLKRNVNLDGSLNINELKLMSTFKKNAILRRWIANQKIRMPSNKQLNVIFKNIIFSSYDAQPKLLIDKKVLCRYKNILYCRENFFIVKNKICYMLLNNSIVLPNNLGELILKEKKININELKNIYTNKQIYLYSKIRKNFSNEKIFIKFGFFNDSFKLYKDNKNYNLKKIWKKLEVAPWLRTNIPLLFYNDKLISAIGLFITDQARLSPNLSNSFFYVYWIHKSYNFYVNLLKTII